MGKDQEQGRGDREQGEKVVRLAASTRAYEPQSPEEIARDRAVFHLRLQGLSIEACAKQLGCTIDEALISLSHMTCMSVEQIRKHLLR
jgi:hypothetical protein